jgi:hypothetical protein
LANQSVLIVASPGKCKTHMIFSITEACSHIPDLLINNWNSVTYYELVQKIALLVQKRLLWTVEEWSMLTDYHRELLMAIASKVQTDRKFERMVSSSGMPIQIQIIDCDLTLLIAIQPFKFRKLMRESENWNALAADRFCKMMLVNPLQTDTKKDPPRFTLPALTPCIDSATPDPNIMSLLTQHLTRSRAELCTLRYMNAWCQLNNIPFFREQDGLAFKVLYAPYLELWTNMIISTDPDREESFHTGPFRIIEYMMEHWNEEVHINQLENHFHIATTPDIAQYSDSTMYRHLRMLESKGLIHRNSPTYSLAPKYRNYFETYKENWS